MTDADLDRIRVYFLRHTFAERDDLVRELHRRGMGAVDYEGGVSLSVEPSDYKDPVARRVIQRLLSVTSAGTECLFACDYRVASNAELVVGRLDCDHGLKGMSVGGIDVKVVKLKDPKALAYRDWPLFAASHPQRGTFCEWHSMRRSIAHWYYRGRVLRDVTALGPAQLEVLCHEWLRDRHDVCHLLAPVGRGLKDIDIAAVRRDRTRLFAQVTFACSAETTRDKAARLKSVCRPEDAAILFADREPGTLHGCEVVSIRQVFSESRAEILDDLLGGM